VSNNLSENEDNLATTGNSDAPDDDKPKVISLEEVEELDDDEEDEEVEADLDAILKERIAAGDDEEDDEDDEETPAVRTGSGVPGDVESVIARGENEFSCPHCFLLVNSAAVVDNECPHCGGPLDQL